MSDRPEESRLGELVGGKYRVVRFLAQGGMGAVYEALHTVVKRRFAVKFLHRDLARRREILKRFQREAEAAGALESENVAAAVDFGIASDGSPYIVMEYLVGEDVRALLKREARLDVGRAADLVMQACRGVQAAHEAGILHRDLKPDNLFVCRRDNGTDLLKVLDFGVAKLQDVEDNSGVTRSGGVVGTASYMSPEQARGEVVDERADVYALGAILYELLSAERPHPGDVQHAVLFHIATQPAVPLGSLRPELPAALIEVVERALVPSLTERYESAQALGGALASFARRETWPSPAERPVTSLSELVPAFHAAAPAPSSVATTAAPELVRRTSGSRRGLAVGAAVVALLIGGAVSQRMPSAAPSSSVSPPSPVLVANDRVIGVPSVEVARDERVVHPPQANAEPALPVPQGVSTRVAAASLDELPSSVSPAASLVGRPRVRPSGRPVESQRPTIVTPRQAASVSASQDPAPTLGAPVAPVPFDQQNPYK